MTKVQLWLRLNALGIDKSMAEIEAALATIDQEAIRNQERSRYRVEIWDRVSPINGIPAERILQRADVPEEGEIYLLYVDDQLRYLQPHDPFQAGILPMSNEDVLSIANRHIDELAMPLIEEKVFELALEKLIE
ncbi:MAG: hypothetical protein K6T65_13365 [Peptococcaceae bacterium]|nr:hypothetical protein [Peptococcaceae bacterium]